MRVRLVGVSVRMSLILCNHRRSLGIDHPFNDFALHQRVGVNLIVDHLNTQVRGSDAMGSWKKC